MTLNAYLQNLNARSSGACTAANDTVYLFGGNYGPPWLSLLDEYALPRCRTCADKDNAAVSFGVGGVLSGVSWHRHGPGFAEVFHGAKRWFLLPPDGPVGMHSFNANQSVAAWVHDGLKDLPDEARIQHCTIVPGELIYFPHNWPHATLNLDPYTSFASTFLMDG
jgi:hypothetical protein